MSDQDEDKRKKLLDAYKDLPEGVADDVVKAEKQRRRDAEEAARRKRRQQEYALGILLAFLSLVAYQAAQASY